MSSYREACSSADLSDRPYFSALADLRGGSVGGKRGSDFGIPGVLTSSGENWAEQRRFTLHALRDLVRESFNSSFVNFSTAILECSQSPSANYM